VSRQKLGQHFLRSEPVLQRIAAALEAEPGDLVVEIGPGRGALTRVLLDRGYRVEAVELDPTLVQFLQENWPQKATALHVHQGDVLDTDLRQWGPARFVGNLPYYITSPILRKLFSVGELLECAVLLMQREVAERLVAKPGTRDYGFLSVLTQWHTTPEILLRVPPGAFHVPPKVDSSVVRLRRSAPKDLPIRDEHATAFETFLGWCFSQKRKTLRNNLRSFVKREVLDTLPEASLRAEQLGLEAFSRLFAFLEKENGWLTPLDRLPSMGAPHAEREGR
jgi:16S rRNA (adenine1518-N6/adenine1519-N6)-dimethyltransferase